MSPRAWTFLFIVAALAPGTLLPHAASQGPPPPPAPVPTGPGSPASPGPTLSTLQPTFTWEPVAGATSYELYVRKWPLENGSLVVAQGFIPGTSFTPGPGILEEGVPYRWNVFAHTDGQRSEGSARLYFQTARALPDLVIAGVTVATGGDRVTVNCTIRNAGTAEARGSFPVASTFSGATQVGSLPSLLPGRAVTWTATFPAPSAGVVPVACLVNERGRFVEESNVDNNGWTTTWAAPAPSPVADFGVESVFLDPPTPHAGDDVTAGCVVTSRTGSPSVDGLVVAFSLDGAHLGTTTVSGTTAAEGIARLRFREDDAGGHALACRLATPAGVSEASQANNEATRSFQWLLARATQDPEGSPVAATPRGFRLDRIASRGAEAGDGIVVTCEFTALDAPPGAPPMVRATLGDAYQGARATLGEGGRGSASFPFRTPGTDEPVVTCTVDPEGEMADSYRGDNSDSRTLVLVFPTAPLSDPVEPPESWQQEWIAGAIVALGLATFLLWAASFVVAKLRGPASTGRHDAIERMLGVALPVAFSLATQFPLTAASEWWGYGLLLCTLLVFVYAGYEFTLTLLLWRRGGPAP